MKLKYTIDHIPKTVPYNRRPSISMVPEFITIHSTANESSSARNERAWVENPSNKRTASWHICVDEKEAIEMIPLNEVAWHAGDGGSGTGNRKSIAIEICESGNRQKTLENAVMLVAKMLKERKWGVDKLRRHYDWSKKNCPRIMSASNWAGWDKFKQDVQKKLVAGGVNMADEDKNRPSSWALAAWEWAKREGYLDGNRPKDPLTREEFAVVLKKLVYSK